MEIRGRAYRICASVTGKDEQAIARAALAAEELGVDLVELRLDSVEGLDREKVRSVFRMTAGLGVPRIATVMPSSIFGRFSGSPKERAELLLEAASHADYVDLGAEILGEVDWLLERVSRRSKVILSWHANRMLTVQEMKEFARSRQGCSVYKIAMPARSVADNLVALEGCLALEGVKRVVFCYGRDGVPSRVLSPLFGAEWAYAALRKGEETAPGQVDVETLKRIREAFA
ncbi:MAG: type I 3-dehydroquinate dehydratase [Candidatus Methanosuratincola sp.]|nr:type I 3-dehydroquinate dehydratase [Candidatus Methanosuratincola sp.]